jgi:hypothetical protein
VKFWRQTADKGADEVEMDDNCIRELCDPDGLPLGHAIRLARAVARIEPALTPSLRAYVGYLADRAPSDHRSMQRALEVLCSVSDPRSFLAACERVEGQGNPVAGTLMRWLAAKTGRRMSRVRT